MKKRAVKTKSTTKLETKRKKSKKVISKNELQNIKIIEQQVKAYNKKALKAFLSFYSPNIEIFNIQSNTPIIRGGENLHLKYSDLFEHNPKLKCSVINRLHRGNYIIDEELITGLTDTSESIHGIVTYYIEDKVIRKVWILS